MSVPCPTPGKTRFATPEAARTSAARFAKNLRTYECTCGWHHLTSKPAPAAPIADAAVTQHVTALGDAEFEVLVAAEATDKATPQQAAALRSLANVDRWLEALRHINADLHLQLVAARGDNSEERREWRRRIQQVIRQVTTRKQEAKAARQQAYLAAGKERVRLEAEGLTVPQARAAAGDAAVQRLIDAHQGEFGRLLEEEYAKAGLRLPNRVVRHLAANAVAGSA